MKLLFGTSNPAKMRHMQEIIQGLDIELMSLKEINFDCIEVDEEGNDPLENARIKALFYYQQTGRPVFSCDSGLYLEGVEVSRQPGVHVRRVGGKALKDEEMIEYYTALAKEHGGEVIGRYRNAIVLVLDENNIYCHDGEDIASERFILASKPHKTRIAGFPLNSISVEINSKKYYFDLNIDDKDSGINKGFSNFFIRTLK